MGLITGVSNVQGTTRGMKWKHSSEAFSIAYPREKSTKLAKFTIKLRETYDGAESISVEANRFELRGGVYTFVGWNEDGIATNVYSIGQGEVFAVERDDAVTV